MSKIERIRTGKVANPTFQLATSTASQPFKQAFTSNNAKSIYKPNTLDNKISCKVPLRQTVPEPEPSFNIYFEEKPSGFINVPEFKNLVSELELENKKQQQLEDLVQSKALASHLDTNNFIESLQNRERTQTINEKISELDRKLEDLPFTDDEKAEIKKDKVKEFFNQDYIQNYELYRDMKGEPLPQATQDLQMLKDKADRESELIDYFGGGSASEQPNTITATEAADPTIRPGLITSVDWSEFDGLQKKQVKARLEQIQKDGTIEKLIKKNKYWKAIGPVFEGSSGDADRRAIATRLLSDLNSYDQIPGEAESKD